jgi:hypothetical protein
MSDKKGIDGPAGGRLATVTHARLRAAQGDVSGARALLLDILHRNPGHQEAARLLAEISGRPDAMSTEESARPPLPPEAGDPADLKAGFKRFLSDDRRLRRAKIERLEKLLRRLAGGKS